MRRLLVLRHAKSSWKHRELEDHDRPLNARGLRDAPRMGELIAARALLPEWVVASTAVRVRQTVLGLFDPVDWSGELHLSPRLYGAAPAEILSVLRNVPDRVERVMVVGHNPGLEELVRGLTGRTVTMPTAALAVIDGPWDGWGALSLDGSAELMDLFKPKALDRA